MVKSECFQKTLKLQHLLNMEEDGIKVNKDEILINIIDNMKFRLKGNNSQLAYDLNTALNEIIEKHKLDTDQHYFATPPVASPILNDVFQEQIKLNERINPTLYTDIENQDVRREWFMRYELAMRQESAEAIDSLNWKWWKKTPDDWDNIKIELVDILHFWVSMCTIAGMTANDVFELYFKKNQLNHHRQENGYKQGTYEKIKDGVEDNKLLID